MSSILGGPTKEGLNNGTTTVEKGMPIKDLSSDNGSSFTMGRRTYGRAHQMIQPTQAIVMEKKWYAPRDGSSVIERRKNNAIGLGSLNANGGDMSFTNGDDVNLTRQALSRTRKGGSVVPKKVTRSTEIFK
jgi:hypothetical protein